MRLPRWAAYRADPVTPTGVRREESGEDLRVRSEPWRRPAISNPWNLAGGQRGMDGRRDNADDDGSPTARGGGRRDAADEDRSPTARGGGRRDAADDDESPTARGGGRRDAADKDRSPTARGGGRRDNADDDASPNARGGGRRDAADGDGSPTARGGGRRDAADDDGSPTARGGGRHDAADEEEFPTARGGGKRDIANDEQDLPAEREEGRQGYKNRDEGERVRREMAREDDEEDRNGERSPGGRCEEVGKQIGNSGKTSGTTRSDTSEARLGGSGGATEKEEKGAGEGFHRTVPEQREEVSSGGSKSSIARNVRLCKERGDGVIRRGTGRTAKMIGGGVRVQLKIEGYDNTERDRVGQEQLVRGWSEHCTGQAREAEERRGGSEGLLCQIGEALGAGIWGDGARRQRHGSEAVGRRSGARDGGGKQVRKVRAWAVAEGEEKDEQVGAWAAAEGEEKDEQVGAWAVEEGKEKDEKEEAGVCELGTVDTEGEDKKVGAWAAAEGEGKDEKEGAGACEPAAPEAEEREEQVGAGACALAVADVEEKDEQVGAGVCVPAAAEVMGQDEKGSDAKLVTRGVAKFIGKSSRRLEGQEIGSGQSTAQATPTQPGS
ncbi:unnamed protein product [Closterium sp. Naga37s-1]|nr:unnamed protein product [Closterium sp. Naga37s-1]